jgi:pimeloyl-ACP methyl ester carboxylesterase
VPSSRRLAADRSSASESRGCQSDLAAGACRATAVREAGNYRLLAGCAGFFDVDPNVEVMAILPEIVVPALVTHGRADRLIHFAAAECLAARLPDAQLYAFEGKGHLPLFTATDEFCDVLRRFVRTETAVARGRCGE